jgi:phospholipase C
VSDNLIDQSSIVKFIEYNWQLPLQGNGAADLAAGSLGSLFDFRHATAPPLFLDPASGVPVHHADRG